MLNNLIKIIKKVKFFDPVSSLCDTISQPYTFVVRNRPILALWAKIKSLPAIGIFCAFTSVLFWSFTGLSFKLNQHIHALAILTISSLIVSITYLVLIFTLYGVRSSSDSKVQSCPWTIIFGVPGERFSLLMRCLCGTISLACFYSSYRYIPLGDATTIRFTSPVFIAIFAHFLVNEPFGILQAVNAFTTLAGVILIGRPSFLFGTLNKQPDVQSVNTTTTIIITSPLPEPESSFTTAALFGVLLSLVAAISISISMIFMRKLKKTPAPLVIFWFSLSNVLLGATGLEILGEFHIPTGLACWLLILLTTFCSGLDQFFITLALKQENAGAVAVIQALCVVLSFIFSILILHEPLYWTSALGGTCIFLSVLVLGFSKMLQGSQCRSKIKSTIFQINIRHSHSGSFNFDKLSGQFCGVVSTDSADYHQHFAEPYLIRVAPIDPNNNEYESSTTSVETLSLDSTETTIKW